MKCTLPRVALAAILLSAPASFAQYQNGQSATVVLGQPSFAANGASTTIATFDTPEGVVEDPASGKVFVADTFNNRVLRFSSSAALASGTSAEFVFGQASFNEKVAGSGLDEMNRPSGLYLDAAGRLWVADTGNNRILRFDGAADFAGGDATAAFGSAGTSDFEFSAPYSVTGDSSGNIYVVDRGNNRVLRFASPLSPTPIATGLFGQSNFSAATPGLSSTTLNTPTGAVVDGLGTLWVADTANNRVVGYPNAATAPVGAAASYVLGQATFTTNAPGTTPSQLQLPASVEVDPAGRLYVADFSNNRVLVFSGASVTTPGASASFVLGQPNFQSGGAANPPTAASLNLPHFVDYSADGFLWIADRSNNRILKYAVIPGLPVINAPANVEVETRSRKTFTVTLRNTGASDEFTLKATFAPRVAQLGGFTFTYQGQNITSDLRSGRFVTPTIPAGGRLRIRVQARSKSATLVGRMNFNLSATSATSPSVTTVKQVSVRVVR